MKKKALLLALLCLLVTRIGAARAQGTPPAQSGQRMKIAGIALTSIGIAGVAMSVIGGVLLSRHCPGDIDQSGCDAIPGAWLVIIGVPLATAGLGAGIPLWVIGARRENQVATALYLTPAALPRGGTGLALSLRF